MNYVNDLKLESISNPALTFYLGYVFDFSLLQVKKLDDSEFRNAFARGYVRVCINLDTLSIAI